ncbi:MAG TPA: hypothetical protein VME23_03265 [Terracidiphilus sp.]|nr:hypothetical protein [Terracidiphilus sp.]
MENRASFKSIFHVPSKALCAVIQAGADNAIDSTSHSRLFIAIRPPAVRKTRLKNNKLLPSAALHLAIRQPTGQNLWSVITANARIELRFITMGLIVSD